MKCQHYKKDIRFVGEIIVWDLNREDDLVIASSGIGDDSHREPVCKVQWIPDPESKDKKYNVRPLTLL